VDVKNHCNDEGEEEEELEEVQALVLGRVAHLFQKDVFVLLSR